MGNPIDFSLFFRVLSILKTPIESGSKNDRAQPPKTEQRGASTDLAEQEI